MMLPKRRLPRFSRLGNLAYRRQITRHFSLMQFHDVRHHRLGASKVPAAPSFTNRKITPIVRGLCRNCGWNFEPSQLSPKLIDLQDLAHNYLGLEELTQNDRASPWFSRMRGEGIAGSDCELATSSLCFRVLVSGRIPQPKGSLCGRLS